jgi:DNA-binding transcriptional regulator LsrR (DeoR family)
MRYSKPMLLLTDESTDQLRFMVKVARLYHEHDLKQPEIATQLGISQARVSRLLKQAQVLGIVKTTVHVPPGMFTELEEQIEQIYGLREVVVVDTGDETEHVIPALGASAAAYLETALVGAKRIGISSWSETLLATVNAMRPVSKSSTQQVVQVLGGLGQPSSQAHATRLTERLAQLLGAQPVFFPVPGVVGSSSVYQSLMEDPPIQQLVATFEKLSLVLLGIGSLNLSRLIRESGNVISEQDQKALRQASAVGDVCQRFFDLHGKPLETVMHDRVLGISPEQLKKIPRRIGIAGGNSKFEAIRAVALGKWVDTLITDVHVAQRMLSEQL